MIEIQISSTIAVLAQVRKFVMNTMLHTAILVDTTDELPVNFSNLRLSSCLVVYSALKDNTELIDAIVGFSSYLKQILFKVFLDLWRLKQVQLFELLCFGLCSMRVDVRADLEDRVDGVQLERVAQVQVIFKDDVV